MLWRVILFLGVVVSVLLMAGSLWVNSITAKASGCAPGAPAGPYPGSCDPAYVETVIYHPHADQARYLRYAAGGVFLVTLASLPMLAAGRRRGHTVDSQGRVL